MKYGFETTSTLRNPYAVNTFPTIATFSVAYTQANYLQADGNSGDALATALLGYPSSSSFTPQVSYAYATHYYAVFIQDDWKITRNLTLNLGFRYDYQTPMTERYDRQIIGFDPNATYTLGTMTLRGGPIWADKGHRSPYAADKNNFGPRLGFAYSFYRKAVVRGGWGINYVQAYSNGSTTGFSVTTNSVDTTTDNGRTPVLVPTTSNPLSGLLANGGTSLYPATLNAPPLRTYAPPTLGGSITYINPDFRTPYVHQFNISIQVELPFRSVLSVEYNGSRSRAIAVSRALNSGTKTQYLTLGSKLSGTVSNPYAGLLPGTTINGSTITLQQSLLPYPQYTGLTVSNLPLGSLWYDSLQARWEKRFSRGLSSLATFTWGKNMGRTDYMNSAYDDINDLRTVIQSQDQKLRFTWSMSYQVPFFKNGLSSNLWVSRFTKQALSGWTLSSVLNVQTGTMIGTPSGVFNTGVDPTAPTQYWSGPTLNRWFNTCTITLTGGRQNCLGTDEPAAWRIQPSYTLNALSPRYANLRNLRPPVADVSLFKGFALPREGMKFEIYAQAFNVTNSPWFGAGGNSAGINTSVNSSSFGKITFAQGNEPRIIQVAAKFVF